MTPHLELQLMSATVTNTQHQETTASSRWFDKLTMSGTTRKNIFTISNFLVCYFYTYYFLRILSLRFRIFI